MCYWTLFLIDITIMGDTKLYDSVNYEDLQRRIEMTVKDVEMIVSNSFTPKLLLEGSFCLYQHSIIILFFFLIW